MRRLVHLALDVGGDRRELRVGREAVGAQELGEPRDRIAPRFGFALRRRLVQLLVVGQRVRVRPDDARVHERRTLARADVRGRLAHRAEAGEEIGAVDRIDVQAGKRSRRAARCRRPASATSTGTEIA